MYAAALARRSPEAVVTGLLVSRTCSAEDGCEAGKLEVAIEELDTSLLFRDLTINR